MEEEKSKFKQTQDKVDEMYEEHKVKKEKKEKKFKIPWRARVSKIGLRRGMITIQVINENKSIDFVKKPITHGTYELNGDIYSLNEQDIYFYRGRPFIHQPKTKLNPWDPLRTYLNSKRNFIGKPLDINEIQGQRLVMSRMKTEAIMGSKKAGWGTSIIIICILAIIGYSFLTGG